MDWMPACVHFSVEGKALISQPDINVDVDSLAEKKDSVDLIYYHFLYVAMAVWMVILQFIRTSQIWDKRM